MTDRNDLSLQVDPTIAGYGLGQRAANIVKQLFAGSSADDNPEPWLPYIQPQ